MNDPTSDEAGRLQEVRRFRILDSPPEAAFERLTRLAARLFNVPIAIIKLIDEDRQWLKSSYGLDFLPPERAETLGIQAILTDAVLVVPDAQQDARFAQNPLVTGETAIRFYAAAPLHTADGFNVGVFAIMDTAPREMSESEISALADLAALAVEKMELRLLPGGLSETDSERREEDLLSQQSEDHFRALIENAADIIGVVDADGTMRYNSPSIESLLGYAPAELNGKNAFDLMHPDDVERAAAALMRAIQEPDGGFVTEYRFRHQDGSWRVLESVGKTLPVGGLAPSVLLTSRDVTERKQAEADRAQLAAIVEHSQDAIIGKSLDGTVLTWNAAAQRIYGYSAEEVIGRSIGALVPPGHPDQVSDMLERVGRGELIEHMETRRVRRDGQVIDVSLTISPIRDLAGRVTGLSTIAREITERKASDFALQEAKDQLQVVLDTIPGGVSWIDSDLQYHGVNRYLAETFQRPAETFIGQHIGFMDVSPTYAELVRDFMASPQQQTSFEFTIYGADSTRTMLMMARKYEAARAVFVSTDITARKQAEADLQKSHDELELRIDRRTKELADVVESLRESEERFRLLVEGTKDYAMFLMDTQRKIVHWNAGAERITGYDKSEALGQSADIIFTPEDRERDVPELETREAAQNGRAAANRWHIRKDGTRFWADGAMAAIHDENGQLSGFAKIMRDATRQKQTEQALQESEDRYRNLIDTASDIIYQTDVNGNFTFFNPVAMRIMQYPAEELTGRNYLDLIEPAHRAAAARFYRRQFIKKVPETYYEYPAVTGDGPTVWLGQSVRLLMEDNQVTGFQAIARDITASKQAEQALRESEGRFRQLVEQAADAFFIIDGQGRFVDVNERACKSLGYSREELLALDVNAIDGASKLENFRSSWNSTLKSGAITREGIHRRKDGTNFPVEIRASVFEFGGERLMLALARDVTERKEAEATLQAVQARLQFVLSTTPAVIYTADATEKPNTTFMSENARTQLGYEPQEIIDTPDFWVEHLHPDDRPRLFASLPSLFEHDSLAHEYRMRRRDGSYRWIYDEMKLVRDAQGKPSEIVGFALDITERKETEEALRESEARKGAILETALDCIITIDREGKVLEWNPAAENTFGFSRDEATGQLLGELIVPEALRERHYQGIAHYLATEEGPVLGNRLEVPALRADGSEILVELSITPILSDNALVFTAYLRDITARKQTEASLIAATAEAERANRAKSEFLSRMSHELRTPLNAILGFGQLLEMDELNDEQSQGVEQILKGGRHLLELINEVLDLARIESEEQMIEIEPVPVGETLTGALDMVRPLASTRGIELRADYEAFADVFVLADRRRLNQALLNLLANAVKYNREGGIATLSCQTTADGQVQIAVSDTGLGIAPDKLDRLFTPFERLGAEQTEVEGTGLGLALTKRLVEAMGGVITVQSTPEIGSTFTVELPLAVGQAPPALLASRQTAARVQATASETQAVVLYIEDNLSNFGLVKNILRHRAEIKLMAAMRGSVGLELAQRHRPDLILLDYHLPDINGDEVLRRLRESPDTREIPVIVVSADATPHQIERMRAAGAVDYLTKPLDVKRFLTTLDESLKH